MRVTKVYGFDLQKFFFYKWPNGWVLESGKDMGTVNPSKSYELSEFGNVVFSHNGFKMSFEDFFNKYAYPDVRTFTVTIPASDEGRFTDMCEKYEWRILK